MSERVRPQAGSDGISWWCHTCKTKKSICKGSFFSKSKLTLQKWLIAILWWTRQYPVTQMAIEAEIGEDTACNIYQWLREVCSTKLIQLSITLGGPGVIVQIDESQFKHKPKVIHHHYISAPVPSSPILLFILKTVAIKHALKWIIV